MPASCLKQFSDSCHYYILTITITVASPVASGGSISDYCRAAVAAREARGATGLTPCGSIAIDRTSAAIGTTTIGATAASGASTAVAAATAAITAAAATAAAGSTTDSTVAALIAAIIAAAMLETPCCGITGPSTAGGTTCSA